MQPRKGVELCAFATSSDPRAKTRRLRRLRPGCHTSWKDGSKHRGSGDVSRLRGIHAGGFRHIRGQLLPWDGTAESVNVQPLDGVVGWVYAMIEGFTGNLGPEGAMHAKP